MPFNIIMIPNIVISNIGMWELIGLSGAGSAGTRLPLGNALTPPGAGELLLLSIGGPNCGCMHCEGFGTVAGGAG